MGVFEVGHVHAVVGKFLTVVTTVVLFGILIGASVYIPYPVLSPSVDISR